MGKTWKVKSARVKGENLVIVAEREFPLARILEREVMGEVLEGKLPRPKAGKKEEETEEEEEEEPETEEEEEEDEEVSGKEVGRKHGIEEVKRRLGIEAEEEEAEEEEDEEEEEEEKLIKVAEGAGRLQDKIEEVEMVTDKPVSKMKGQKGRILVSLDNGNETASEISNDTTIGKGSVCGNLTWLFKDGFVKRTGRGRYKITAKGKSYLKKLERL